MPIYEYECIEKGHRFEVSHSMTVRPLKKCNVCGGKARKLISASSFMLKGSGWYKDGYSSSKEKKKTDSATAEPCVSAPVCENAGACKKAAGAAS